MYRYELKILKGTLEYVKEELLEKLPLIEILSENETEIILESSVEDIEEFRILLSPLLITQLASGKSINLSRREWRKEFVPAGINPSLAYILCKMAKLSENDILYDPFCGASVIPITALKYFNAKRVICSDISGKAIFKSKVNFKVANISESKYLLFQSDIKNVRLNKQNVDRIVTNLPFGIRAGNHEGNIQIYSELETLAKKILRKKGFLLLLTQEKKLLREVFNKENWLLRSVARIDVGGLKPEVFVIERR